MATATLISKADYLREARRVRGTYASRPAEMHARLTALARRRDTGHQESRQAMPVEVRRVATAVVTRPGSVLGVSGAVAESFALRVEASLEAGRLRFTARERLLIEADALGIRRFDANLIIASVVHANGARGNDSQESPGLLSGPWGIASVLCCAVAGLMVMAYAAM